MPLDANTLVNLAVVLVYFGATLWLGARMGSGNDVEDYFLAGREMPWWSASLSIVGTETSTLTFVGVPAIAYGGDLTFLQVALGYVIGRFVVAWLLVPAYFAGHVLTAYELLAQRFGGGVRRFASLIFLVSRVLADGVRLFSTALVLQALLPLSLPVSIGLIAGITLVYTLRGGLRAVIWNDAVQLVVYVAGAVVAGLFLINRIPGGWPGATQILAPLNKLRVLDFGWDWANPYVFWAGVIGGATLTTATHGTDQMFVQRLLACRSARAARRAVIVSGGLVLAQMALFLLIGSLLFAFYQTHPPAVPFASNDQVFARFIAEEMPVGLSGLVIAAVFAAAMSTLSSSMSSLASASTLDFLLGRGTIDRSIPASAQRDALRLAQHERAMRLSRWTTILAAIALAVVAGLARAWGSVLEVGLTITSITFGAVLGIFLVGLLGWQLRQGGAIVSMLAGLVAALAVQQAGVVAWTWLTPLGALTTVAVAALASLRAPPASSVSSTSSPSSEPPAS